MVSNFVLLFPMAHAKNAEVQTQNMGKISSPR